MKNLLIILSMVIFMPNAVYSAAADVMMGVGTVSGIVTGAVTTKNIMKNSDILTDAYVRNIDAQTENIKKDAKIQIIRQPDGSAKIYQNGVEVKNNVNPNSPEYQLGLKMAENMSNYLERKDAQAKLKQIKGLAKIEGDTETLAIIKKYKKAGAIITLQKIEEHKKQESENKK